LNLFVTSSTTSASDSNLNIASLIDIIVLAPPWGGINYTNLPEYDVTSMVHLSNDINGFQLISLATKITPNIIYLLPKNTTKRELNHFARVLNINCRIENIFLHGKLKMTVAYFGPLFSLD
jgi:hypothetical protein